MNPCGTNSTTQYSKNGTILVAFCWLFLLAESSSCLGLLFFAALLHCFVLLEGFTCMRLHLVRPPKKEGKRQFCVKNWWHGMIGTFLEHQDLKTKVTHLPTK